MEAGIIQFWFREMNRIYGESKFFDLKSQRENVRLPLTLENLSGAFYLLCFGHLLSSATFIIEIVLCQIFVK